LVMKITISNDDIQHIDCDVLVVSATRTKSEPGFKLSPGGAEVDTLLSGLLSESNRIGEFKASAGELFTVHTMGKLAARRVLIVGLGVDESRDMQVTLRAAATAARHAQNTGAHHIVLGDRSTSPEYTQAMLEGALLGLYTFRKYQSNNENRNSIEQISLLAASTDQGSLEQVIQKAQVLAEATNFARTLINEPPAVLTPTELANRAIAMAQQVGLEHDVFDKDRIIELGMGGLLAVSQGSDEPPKFVILRYRGDESTQKGMALVGKGITFDTGGISIKPAAGMDEMKGDMGGAAAVLGAMQAIAQLKPRINVTGLVPTCENMPSGSAYLPGDIVRPMNGTTIEIVNTDAEGRLILADALSFAVKEGLTPIIDLATLTGGIVVALGSKMTGLFSNNEELTKDLLDAGRAAGEKYWPMPLDDDYNEYIRSEIADIKQTGGREASSVTAAKILEHYIAQSDWAHLDIAGTSYAESKKSYQEKGGIGVGVRTLTEFALQRARKDRE
jgi:leucyl aminopeptidase